MFDFRLASAPRTGNASVAFVFLAFASVPYEKAPISATRLSSAITALAIGAKIQVAM
jgi:hypothetical protein